MVFTSKLDPSTSRGWRYVQFATGLNRLGDFNNHAVINGNNNTNSLIDSYAAYATDNNLSISDIEGTAENGYTGMYAYDLNLAWWTYLLNPALGGGYAGYIPSGKDKLQTKSIDSHGSMNEYIFSFAANYSDRLYIGTTFGLPFVHFTENSTYTEDDVTNSIIDFKYFTRYENLETHGNGFNFKVGLIYRITDWFRFGVAFHSPSWYNNLNDHWMATMTAQYEKPDTSGYTQYSVTNSGDFEYDLTTPLRVQGNAGFIIGNIGLVSVDYEFVDYSAANLGAYNYSFNEENLDIENGYRIAHNFRVGTEWRYNIFSFRAGGRFETSPYADNINDGSLFGFSGGVGLRQGPFYLDLAYVFTGMQEDYYLYNSSGVAANPSENTIRTHTILTTFGLKF
jgi:long-subunit fatty acid transport protein